ncbi:hypothetical protein CY35_16G098600 [Sphagnum magellanicum]|nr:hypothetical protein CY35_16G098600 [Sphagnum magellanicum]KAH9538278.1 hypothetical protein CY35_16G098600 [Sphagnum magellanicum]KAH9538279.1 hypothetical protein CY35_16G098600 [Sphagnum magellanicum]
MVMSAASPLRRLVGKVAVITGAATGIGHATARLFVAHGAKVVIADVKDDAGQTLANELGTDCSKYIHCDVSKESHVAAAVNLAVHSFGKLDILYNNAGIPGPMFPFEALPVDEFQKLLDVNLLGTVIGIKHAAKAMIPAKQGVIISTASTTGSIAGTGPAAYSISKAGVIAATYSASAQLTKHGIRVNCISPGLLATSLTLPAFRENYPDLSEEQLEKMVELENFSNIAGARLTPEVVAKAALFLASDDSPYISGHNLVVDGGYLTNKSFSSSSNLSF